jgi:hypothetical protein
MFFFRGHFIPHLLFLKWRNIPVSIIFYNRNDGFTIRTAPFRFPSIAVFFYKTDEIIDIGFGYRYAGVGTTVIKP